MSLSPREQIIKRARLNNWQLDEQGAGALRVSKNGHWISVRFGRRGQITHVGSSTAQFTRGDKLGQVLRLMGTLPIG